RVDLRVRGMRPVEHPAAHALPQLGHLVRLVDRDRAEVAVLVEERAFLVGEPVGGVLGADCHANRPRVTCCSLARMAATATPSSSSYVVCWSRAAPKEAPRNLFSRRNASEWPPMSRKLSEVVISGSSSSIRSHSTTARSMTMR